MSDRARTLDERREETLQLQRLAHGGPAALEREHRAPIAAPARPPAPARDADLVLGVLDGIAENVAAIAATQRGPAGEGTVARAASVAAPAAGQTIVSIAAPGGGRYRVRAIVGKDAGALAVDLELRVGALVLSPLLVDSAGALTYDFDEIRVDRGEPIEIRHPAGAAGTFTGFLAATRVE